MLDPLNVHRLLVTSVMLAAKFFDDHYLDNQHYAAVGGVPKGEMNILELEFLFLLEFNLHVTQADYDMYRTALHAKFEGTMHPRHFLEDPYKEESTGKAQTRHHHHHNQGHHGQGAFHPHNAPQIQAVAQGHGNNGWRDVR